MTIKEFKNSDIEKQLFVLKYTIERDSYFNEVLIKKYLDMYIFKIDAECFKETKIFKTKNSICKYISKRIGWDLIAEVLQELEEDNTFLKN